MIIDFDANEVLVHLRKAHDAAQEATYEASQVSFDAGGTPLEAVANAAWEATSDAVGKIQEALAEAELREMVAAIKAALEAASVRFTVEMHPFTVYAKTDYPWDVPGAIFRFPGHDDFVLEAHEIFDDEDEELHYSFGLGVDFRRNGKGYDAWFVDHDLDELINQVFDGLTTSENSERRNRI